MIEHGHWEVNANGVMGGLRSLREVEFVYH
jgi:hypothetical protein